MTHPVDELRRLEPASLKVHLLDGTEQAVAVPKVRNRWARVIQVIDAIAWTKIDALDKSGMLLGSIEDEHALDDATDEAESALDDRDVRIGRLLLEVMRTTQKESRLMMEAQNKATAAAMDHVIAAMHAMGQSYEQSLNITRATQVADTAQASGGNPEIMAMLQLAMSQMNRPAPQIVARPTPQQPKKETP